MPTYEFRCPQGHSFERFYRKISDAVPELACPECGKIAERQLTGGAGLVFKGSGFYLTDYGKNAHRTAAPTGSSGDKGSDSGGDGKSTDGASADTKASDAKPAAAKPTESSSTSGTAAAAKSTTPKSDK